MKSLDQEDSNAHGSSSGGGDDAEMIDERRWEQLREYISDDDDDEEGEDEDEDEFIQLQVEKQLKESGEAEQSTLELEGSKGESLKRRNEKEEKYGDHEDLEELRNQVRKLTMAGKRRSLLVDHFADRVVLVKNLPVVTTEKYDKLREKVSSIFSQIGPLQQDAVFHIGIGDSQGQGFDVPGMYMPFDVSASPVKTMGFAFVVFQDAESARSALEKVNGFAFGKNKLETMPYSDLEKYGNWPEEFKEPPKPKFEEHEPLKAWLADPAGREQFVIRFGRETQVHWCEGIQLEAETQLAYGGEREKEAGRTWCEMYVKWSPEGSYLATFHLQGIMLWGGPNFKKLHRFPHNGVKNVQFSPNERYLVTWDGKATGKDNRSLCVWEISTQSLARGFKVNPGSEWPIMRWSSDSKYFARTTTNGISIFDSASMKLTEGKPVAAKGIVHFEWSPTDSLLAYWAPEEDNVPARVVLLDPASRKEVRAKNLFNVRDVKLHWQKQGYFLCAQVVRHSKSGKTTFSNFELFRMRDAGVPNELLQITETVHHFSFEDNGTRFGIIHGEMTNRVNISFYSMEKAIGGNKLEKTLDVSNKQCDHLIWSPAGSSVVLAQLNNTNGALEFWDLDEKMCFNETEQFMLNGVEWDPSGRMVATSVSQPMFGTVSMRYTLENGYRIWSFQGNKLKEEQVKEFYQFSWRPRPKSVLENSEIEEVKKNLNKFTKKYEKDDQLRKKRRDAAADAERIRQLMEFRSLIQERKQEAEVTQQQRKEMGLVFEDPSSEFEEIEEEVGEELISEKSEFI